MFYVDLYHKDELMVHAPFNEKKHAIRYFNYISDGFSPFFTKGSRVELMDENVCLFDYEV